MIVYIGIGSNLGNRFKNIKSSINLLGKIKGIKINKVSSIYETEPVGYKKQGNFLNCVVKITTSILPKKLLSVLQNIEIKLKRKKTMKWGQRTIDLDILTYENKVISLKELKIPHPLMHKRDFVLVPFAEINKNFIHPAYKKNINYFIRKIRNTNIKKYSN